MSEVKESKFPPLPKAHAQSTQVETIDLRNREAKILLENRVKVDFPVDLETSFQHFQMFRKKPNWKPFQARGIKDKKTGIVTPMDMGSCKTPFVVKPAILQSGQGGHGGTAGLLIPMYRFTYLAFRDKSKWNWSYELYDDIAAEERAVFQAVFRPEMNHILSKLYRSTHDLADKNTRTADETKSKTKRKPVPDSIDWHQDNGKMYKFKDMHPETGFQDYILYSKEEDYRWFQLFDPKTLTTYNLLLPSGALVSVTGQGNRELFHCVPKDDRPHLGDRISIVARHLITYMNPNTCIIYNDKGVEESKTKREEAKKTRNNGEKRKRSKKESSKKKTKRSKKDADSTDSDDSDDSEMKDEMDRLVFYSKASDTAPGYGKFKNEWVNDPKHEKWKELASITNWRRTLSSLFVAPMKIDGYTFQTVEHYLQYRKIALADEKRALEFTVESGSKLGQEDGFAARKARKMVMLSKDQWSRWEALEPSVKEKAKLAKFKKGTLCYRVLMATHDAELWHFAPRCPAIRMKRTEELRDQLKNEMN